MRYIKRVFSRMVYLFSIMLSTIKFGFFIHNEITIQSTTTVNLCLYWNAKFIVKQWLWSCK